MADRPWVQWVPFFLAGALILARLRDMFLPGFLSISRTHGSGVESLVGGVLILGLAVAGRLRRARVTR